MLAPQKMTVSPDRITALSRFRLLPYDKVRRLWNRRIPTALLCPFPYPHMPVNVSIVGQHIFNHAKAERRRSADSDVFATDAGHTRVKTQATDSTRNLRPSVKATLTDSSVIKSGVMVTTVKVLCLKLVIGPPALTYGQLHFLYSLRSLFRLINTRCGSTMA